MAAGNSIIKKIRSEKIDIARGLAILMVMLGHVGTVNIQGYQNSILGNIIWSVQMPIFMIISGYLAISIESVTDSISFIKYNLKKSINYLIPWFIWTIILSLYNNAEFSQFIVYIMKNMDGGYWFLFTIWSINLLASVSLFISAKLIASKFTRNILMVVLCMLIITGLVIVGKGMDLSILGIKFTIYYTPFFLIGLIFRLNAKNFDEKKIPKIILKVLITLVAFIYISTITKINLFLLSDSFLDVVTRFIVSTLGCVLIFYIIDNFSEKLVNVIKYSLCYLGKYSLELYLIHVYFTSVYKNDPMPSFYSIAGLSSFLINFAIMLIITLLILKLIQSNRWSYMVLFAKRK